MTTLTPVHATVAHPVVAAARQVRRTCTAAVVAGVIVLLSVVAFDHVPHVRSTDPDLASLSLAVTAEVSALEATGLVCGTAPTWTDTVVVERPDGPVSVLSFAAALDATSTGAGVIRAYCT